MLSELLQQTSLDLVELDLVAIEILNELLFGASEIRTLLLYDKGQKLILETRFSDSEVNQGALSLDLRRVVRTLQLGVQVEVEVGM